MWQNDICLAQSKGDRVGLKMRHLYVLAVGLLLTTIGSIFMNYSQLVNLGSCDTLGPAEAEVCEVELKMGWVVIALNVCTCLFATVLLLVLARLRERQAFRLMGYTALAYGLWIASVPCGCYLMYYTCHLCALVPFSTEQFAIVLAIYNLVIFLGLLQLLSSAMKSMWLAT